MARAEAASASPRSDSIKGLAQWIARPAYRRLLVAEPALRRAVPALIVAFLLTIAVGSVVQVLDHRRQAIADAINDTTNIADFIAERLERLATETPNASARDLLERASPSRAMASGRQLLLTNAEGRIVAATTAAYQQVGRLMLDVLADAEPLT